MAASLRVGIIGAGTCSRKHLAAYQQLGEEIALTSICDIDSAAAGKLNAEAAAEGGTLHVYIDPHQLLRDAPIDAVDICTTNPSHAELAIAAAEAGKHILVEKPMACSMADCEKMVSAAGKSGVTLMVAQNQHYKPNHLAMRQAIRDGRIGAIRAVRLEAMLNVLSAPPDHWVYDAGRAGGGVVMTFAIHRIDLARFFCGEIRRVHATLRTMHPRFTSGTEDHAAVTMEFASGAIGQLFASFTPFVPPNGESFAILGESGTILSPPGSINDNEPARIADLKRKRQRPLASGVGADASASDILPPSRAGLPTDDMFVNEIWHFAQCIRSRAEPISSGRDNLGTMRTVFAIYESARTGQWAQVLL